MGHFQHKYSYNLCSDFSGMKCWFYLLMCSGEPNGLSIKVSFFIVKLYKPLMDQFQFLMWLDATWDSDQECLGWCLGVWDTNMPGTDCTWCKWVMLHYNRGVEMCGEAVLQCWIMQFKCRNRGNLVPGCSDTGMAMQVQLQIWCWAFGIGLSVLPFWCCTFCVVLLVLCFWCCAFGVALLVLHDGNRSTDKKDTQEFEVCGITQLKWGETDVLIMKNECVIAQNSGSDDSPFKSLHP